VVPWGDKARLHEARTDGSRAEPLPDTDGATWPRWSPDGRHVLFAANDSAKLYDVNARKVLRTIEGAWAPFVWSPEGRQFVVMAIRGENGPVEAQWYNLDGPDPVAVIELPFHGLAQQLPALWLPGTETFALAGGSSAGTDVYVVGPQAIRTVTTSGDVMGFGLSADRRKLLWARAAPHVKGAGLTLYAYDISSGAKVKMPFETVLPLERGREVHLGQAALSPDGKRLALLAWRAEKYVVYTVDIQGTEPRVVHTVPRPRPKKGEEPENTAVVLSIHWAPDGRLAVFKSQPEPAVRVFEADGTGRKLPLPRAGGGV
jgi:dipeptidyl aminopeptidase/acylaminoacyl peptidase